MAATIKLEIVTPEAKIFSDDVDMVTLTGTEGEMGILPQHMPLMTQLVAGEIIAQKGKDTIFLAVGDGFVQVTGDRVAILTDMAIEADDIDEAKAEEARQLAEARLAQKITDEEAAHIQAALAHATTQLKVKQHRKNNGTNFSQSKTARRSSAPFLVSPEISTGNHADFHRLDVHAMFLQPFDRGLYLVACAVQFEADDADFVGHVGLADVRDDLELVADLPNERLLDELGREHQPQSLLGWSCGFRGRQGFFGGFRHGVRIYDFGFTIYDLKLFWWGERPREPRLVSTPRPTGRF